GHAEELTRELAISEEALLSTTRQRDALCERLQATHSELKSTEAALEASEAALEAALEAKRAALADAREQLDEKAAEAALLGYAIVALETALVATPSTDAQAAVVARERSSFAAAEAAAWEAAWETATEDERPLSTRSLEEAEPRWLTDAAHADAMLRVVVATWNLHGKEAPDDLKPWLGGAVATPDVYAIGTQEAQRGIEASVLLPSKAQWLGRLETALGPHYKCVGSQTLVAIHLAVFVRTRLLPQVAHVQSAHVSTGLSTGFAGSLGNKGGVAIALTLGHTSFLFAVSSST
ncbi:endonuclease exonuclease phosphatase family protein, partial [Chrysochromulina tobinii]